MGKCHRLATNCKENKMKTPFEVGDQVLCVSKSDNRPVTIGKAYVVIKWWYATVYEQWLIEVLDQLHCPVSCFSKDFIKNG